MITPDTKDWTWVLHTPCPECGFDGRRFAHDDVSAMVRDTADAWAGLLAGGGPGLRTRPRPDRWSPLEYACHVRDVFRIYDQRLTLMLAEDGPDFPNWDQDATAIEDRYAEADPARVTDELTAAANRLAANFESVSGAQWQRTGSRSDGAQFTVDSFARYLIHDPLHHWWDVTGTRNGS